MITKIIILFKIARKIAQSDIINIISKFHKVPKLVKFFSYILSFSFSDSNKLNKKNLNKEDNLCNSIQEMGTTFIKLGQFLSTRPDIIGDEIAKKLENLQDKLPPFSTDKAKKIIQKELGNNNYNLLLNISEPVAAASIAQVHKAQLNDNGTIKDIAIKILRPNIKKIFNDEIDALMLLAFLIEGTIKKDGYNTTLFDATGLAIEDVATGRYIYEKLIKSEHNS